MTRNRLTSCHHFPGWAATETTNSQNAWQFALCAILLALTVLANFFNAITSILFIGSVILADTVSLIRTTDAAKKKELKNSIYIHLLSPFVALLLTAFWVVPMLSTYKYLVTRPVVRPLDQLMTTPIACWYILAAFGIGIWIRKSVGRIGPYLVGCLILLMGLIFAGTLAPNWFPLQVFRFFATVNFLFCLPVGISIAYVTRLYLEKRKAWVQESNQHRTRSITRVVILSLVIVGALSALAIAMSTKKLTEATAFYTTDNYERIGGPLEFAKEHKDGRYLVEVLPSKSKTALVRSDSLALNAYLGSQGNETISIVYREASPNSSFFNAQLNAFSSYRENFGISSALLDDLDFLDQPIAQHIRRLQFIGVRYLVIASPDIKERVSKEAEVAERHEVGDWTIFTLRQPTLPQIRALNYRPALVVSDFTVKLRSQNKIDFIRLAEEQFSDPWFDVLLTRSSEVRLDHLSNLEKFGALVIDKYEYEDQDRAFNLIKDFAQTHAVILISSPDPLYSRIQSSLSSFPHAYLIDRPTESPGEWIVDPEPTHHYKGSAIQKLWQSIKQQLDKEKIPVAPTTLEASRDQTSMRFNAKTSGDGSNLPILIAQTYHPKWIRIDGQSIYATTPFFTLTFLDKQTELIFKRDLYDRVADWCSLLTLAFVLGLLSFGVWRSRARS